jgi:hypothetical protein
MGKFISWIGVLLLVVIAGIGVAAIYDTVEAKLASKNDEAYTPVESYEELARKSVPFAELIDHQFTNVDEVTATHNVVCWTLAHVFAFKDISSASVENVTNMLLNNRDSVSMRDIVKEYLENRQFYDSIKPNSVIPSTTPEVVDPGAESSTENSTNNESSTLDSSKPVAEQTTTNDSSIRAEGDNPADPKPVAKTEPATSTVTANATNTK